VDDELPTDSELAPPPWQRTPQRASRRRRDPITREAIVDTALRLLDREGLDGLSMRGIAEELDTGAASLYWHVGSKDGLLDLLFDRVIGEQHVPDPEPERWQEQLREVARAQRATILRHRDIVRISLGRIPMGPHALRYSERVLAILRAGGVPDQLAMLGQQLLLASVNGFTLDESAAIASQDAESSEEAQAQTEDAASMVRDYVASLPAQRFPNLIALADYFSIGDADVRFELLLDLFVDGLARRAQAG
jgi:TetR/AcrR family transcriptional regulator, tetracycline repressor protein